MRVQVGAGDGAYEAIVGSDAIGSLGTLIADKTGRVPCAVISDTKVGPLFGPAIVQSLITAGMEPVLITIPAGEQSKTLQQAGSICDQMLDAQLDRRAIVVGLGGGVIGDISGFVAAIFQRGIRHVQIPTTLLAMVDSSIGGKTAVNTATGKNLLGAVHQPSLVIDDVSVLRTLSQREFKQGLAEIVKHGIIAEAELFEELTTIPRSMLDPSEFDGEKMAALIRRNIRIKSQAVGNDETDRTGDRAILNFGHTIGHGIERAGGYNVFMHGEAISLGMVAAARISVRRAGLPSDQADKIVALLRSLDLPVQLPGNIPRADILNALKFDKKFQGREVRFVVTPKIGSAYLSSDVTLPDIEEAVAAL